MRRPVEELRAKIEKVLRAAGASDQEAQIIADATIEAELRGRPTHGLNRLPGIIRWLRSRRQAEPYVVSQHGPCILIDGNDAHGYIVGVFAADHAARLALSLGCAIVGARNTRHTGMIGYFVERVARQGAIALAFSHCFPLVAPWGSAEAVLGTNPIAAAFPAEPQPILIDMGTCATTYGALDLLRKHGGAVPEGSALDATGRPTTDPNAAQILLPFGGAKGYALGLMVQILAGPFVGAKAIPEDRRDYGLLLIAMRHDLFTAPGQYEAALREIVRRVKSARRMQGVAEVLVPGERAFRERERRLREGIEVSDDDWNALGNRLP